VVAEMADESEEEGMTAEEKGKSRHRPVRL
jgi:hypothetical protein